MTGGELESDLKFTTDIPYVALTGELCGVCCEDLGENWPHYNDTALYNEFKSGIFRIAATSLIS